MPNCRRSFPQSTVVDFQEAEGIGGLIQLAPKSDYPHRFPFLSYCPEAPLRFVVSFQLQASRAKDLISRAENLLCTLFRDRVRVISFPVTEPVLDIAATVISTF